ncbi:hypothetical protein RhiirA5_431603 [Rhizophagus irregularis]|uniref:Uncharacterized protein n=1 Tax=Rhizophagus irregularis TaxID=588596 RepID=A0A2I1E7Z8_9GLOM|nr:hypothetical protein RhiirA5_431603 [Rhizophagus irregularis]PKY18233.1 hypothetical protein RhiirB3_522607 [Rhizophagus irregularis]CAB4467172.1 unnamed protein product [Rhizophagus irregularis]CAB5360202.1 unnamed protein product [Rhizophagus irregularis]
MPTSQNSETSNNDDTTKDFIDNYIKDINTYLGDFLKSSQPTYDPNDNSIKDSLPTNTTTTTSSEKEHETQGATTKSSSVSLSELLKSPTVNPDIFSNRPFKDENNNNESSLSSSSPSPSLTSDDNKKQSLAQKLKISEISTDYFNQKKEIWNGALINCSELHIKLQECMSFGGIFDKASLCIKARRKFWDCMEDQKKFLQDSGYASPGKSLAENDEILYEADLYNISKLDKEEQS